MAQVIPNFIIEVVGHAVFGAFVNVLYTRFDNFLIQIEWHFR